MTAFGLIQDESLAQLLRKRLNTMPGFSSLTPELMPVFVAEGEKPDHQFLKGIKLCGGRGTVAAVAAQNSQAAVVNPAGSNIIATVTRIYCEPNTAGSFSIVLNRVAEATLTTVGHTFSAMDMRWGDNGGLTGQPSCRIRAAARAGAANAHYLPLRRAAPTTGVELAVNIVLPPDSTCLIMLETVNVALNNFFFEWTERPRNPSELV